ncbi:hypothetical protein WJF43_25145, partial [Salmonella enterica subsp. enterica serovar Corvallis]
IINEIAHSVSLNDTIIHTTVSHLFYVSLSIKNNYLSKCTVMAFIRRIAFHLAAILVSIINAVKVYFNDLNN